MTTAVPSPSLTTALARFAPVSLEDLSTEADLQVRVDRKYVLHGDSAVGLLHALAPGAALALQIGDRRDFGYESHYFDTPTLDSYRSTALKRRRRFKVRTRRYTDAGETFLEVKTRGPRGATVKHRVPYLDDPVDTLTSHGQDFVATVLGSQAVPLHDVDGLAPVITTSYRRSTLLLPQRVGRPPARATIDAGVRWMALAGDSAEPCDEPIVSQSFSDRHSGSGVMLRGVVIIETKSRGAASALDRMLWSHGHRPVAISKYGTGMAALRRDLPSTRWHRILGRLDAYRDPDPPFRTADSRWGLARCGHPPLSPTRTAAGGLQLTDPAGSRTVATHRIDKETLLCAARF